MQVYQYRLFFFTQVDVKSYVIYLKVQGTGTQKGAVGKRTW